MSTGSSVSLSSLRTSLNVFPGTTKDSLFLNSIASVRFARRYPSTATTSRRPPSMLNRLPWCIGFASLSATANTVWRIILFSTLLVRRISSPSSTFGNSGNSSAGMPTIVNRLTPLSMVAIFFSSTSKEIVSPGVLRTISVKSFALSTALPGSFTFADIVVVMPSSRS